MVFLRPSLLFYAAFALIPLLIHFFGERNYRVFPFSSLQFLDEIKVNAFKRLRIRYWLILACRILWILFLVLALAQPFIKHKNNGFQGKGLLILDETSSTRNSPASFELEDDIKKALTDWPTVKLTDHQSIDSLSQLLRRTVPQEAHAAKNICILSDFQDNALTRELLATADSLADSVFCIQYPFNKNNVALTYLAAEKKKTGVAHAYRLHLALSRENPRQTWPGVYIYVNGKQQGQLVPDENGRADYDLRLPEKENRIMARIQADSYDRDNRRYLVVMDNSQIPIVYVSQNAGQNYVYRALKAMENISLTTITPDRLAVTDLSNYAVLWFDDAYPIPLSQKKRLDKMAQEKAIFLSVNRNIEPNNIWNDVCGTVSLQPVQQGYEEISYVLPTFSEPEIFRSVSFSRRYISDKEDITTLLGMSDGTALLYRLKKLNYVVNLSPFNFSFNKAGESPYFIRQLNAVIGSKAGKSKRNIITGEPIKSPGEIFDVLSPENRRIRSVNQFSETVTPGFYRIKGEKDSSYFAVNYLSDESIQTKISLKHTHIDLTEANRDSIFNYIHGRRSADLFYILAGFMLLLEMILQKSSGKSKNNDR